MTENIISEVSTFIDDASQALNKDYKHWKELALMYEKASNVDLSKSTVSNSQLIATGVDTVSGQLTFPSFDTRLIGKHEDAKIVNILSKNGLEKVLRNSEVHTAFHGYNGVFFNLVLKGNAVGFLSTVNGKIKTQCLPLSNTYFEKDTLSLEDDSNGKKTGVIGYVTRYPNKAAFEHKYPNSKGKGGTVVGIDSAYGVDEVQVFKYFNFRDKKYYEITGNNVLVRKTGADFPFTWKTEGYFNTLLTKNKDKIRNIKKGLEPRNPFFLFRKNYKSDNIYATGLGHRLYEANVNQTKVESGTVLGAINNAIGFTVMNVQKGKKDAAETALYEAIQNIQVGKPPMMMLEVDQNTPANVNKIENIQSQISTDEINVVNAIVERKGSINGVNASGSASTKYKNTQAIVSDNQLTEDTIQHYITVNLEVFKRFYKTVINMIAEHYGESFEKFSIEGVYDKDLQDTGHMSFNELSTILQSSELEVLMDSNSGVIPSSNVRFQKAQAVLSMAAQSNADPEIINGILKDTLALSGVASSNQTSNEGTQPVQNNQQLIQPSA